MGFLLKVFAIFWAIFLVWYLTGGPLRDDKTKPFVGFGENNELIQMGTSSVIQK